MYTKELSHTVEISSSREDRKIALPVNTNLKEDPKMRLSMHAKVEFVPAFKINSIYCLCLIVSVMYVPTC